MLRIGSAMVAVALLGPLSAPPANAQESALDAAARKLAAEYLATWTALDADAFAALFDMPSGWFLVGDMVIPSADSVRAVAGPMMQQRVSNQFTWETMHTTVLNDNAVLFQGIFGGRVTFKNGQVREWKGNGLLTFLAERRGGAWRITAGHASAGSGTLIQQ